MLELLQSRWLCVRLNARCSRRKRKIEEFVALKNYDPTLNLHEYADNLYADVGEVAATLIRLRYNQAEEAIKQLLGNSNNPESNG